MEWVGRQMVVGEWREWKLKKRKWKLRKREWKLKKREWKLKSFHKVFFLSVNGHFIFKNQEVPFML